MEKIGEDVPSFGDPVRFTPHMPELFLDLLTKLFLPFGHNVSVYEPGECLFLRGFKGRANLLKMGKKHE
jgi:hypothetical protein